MAEKEEEQGEIEEMGGGEEPSGCTHGEKPVKVMPPWEQHSAVISLPRYDYAAPSSLLQQSRSGFLITCPIKREKSATKEVITLFEEFVGSAFSSSKNSSTGTLAKKRKLSSELDAKDVESAINNEVNSVPEVSDEGQKRSLNLSLVKLTRSGLLLFTFSNNSSRDVVAILSKIFNSLGSGKLKPPVWCHRIFPIQETCALTEKDLQLVVSKLIEEFLGKDQEKLKRPIKGPTLIKPKQKELMLLPQQLQNSGLLVGFNRRGVNETEMKSQKNNIKDTQGSILLDRDACFKIVAGAVKAVAINSVVDLKSPEVAVLVELLPISGLAHGSLMVGVSVLPLELVTTKPRLCIKTLAADAKVTKRSK